jgi:hypothetical protein
MGKIHLEGCRAWRTLARLGMAALAAGVLAACAQVTPPAPMLTAASAPTPSAAEGDTLAGMQQFADGENNFTFYIPAEWNVFGPDHNAIGSQFIMGPEGTGWTAGEPAAVQISVIDTQAMTLGEALAMLCQGCTAVPTPEPATLTSGLPVLLATGERASADNGGTVPAPFTIVEYGPKAIIFAVDEARAGMNADTLLATFGPFDGTKPAGENTGRGLYAGIGYALPPAPAHWASGEIVDELTDEAGGPWWAPAPKHPEIRLVGYPVEGSVQAPRIVVYPVNDLVAANPEAANRVEQLRQLLSGGEIPADAQLPFLPLTNAGGPLQAQVKIVSFEGGRGVRYLTQHGQGPAPINNQELFYTFQGLTDDGAHYVAVILPITNSSLPDSAASVPEAEHQAQLADYGQYVDSTTQALDAQPDTSFQPSLAELDALVQSISIAP